MRAYDRSARPRQDGAGQTYGYVSEFERFIEDYLLDHPEVVADQHTGWDIYWDKKVDFRALTRAEEDSISAESFYYFGSPHYEHWLVGKK